MLKARPTPMLSVNPWTVQLQSWMEGEMMGQHWSSVRGEQQGCDGEVAWDGCEGVSKLWEFLLDV